MGHLGRTPCFTTNPSDRSRNSPAAGDRAIAWRLPGALLPLLAGLWWTPAALGQPSWSAAVSLARCASVASPRVAFPQADPFHASGPGAIVWSGAPADCNSADATTGPGVGIAEFQPDHTLGAPKSLPGRPPRLSGLSAVTATGDGRIVLTGSLGPPSSGAGAVSEGPAAGPFTPASGLAGQSSPIAATSSYRGEVGVASVDRAGRIDLRLEPPGAPTFGRAVVLSAGGSPVTALAANIDYRGDAIVAWVSKGSVYVRVRAASGVLLPAQRVAASPPSARLGVLISDDNRAIVAWESDQAATTSTYLAISLPGIHFDRPRLLERFVDPPGIRPAASGLQLVRLAHEGVIVGWTGLTSGHLVIRTAPVSLASTRPTTTVSAPDADAMLSALATGPRDEVIAVWTAGPRLAGRPDPSAQRILAARGASESSGLTKFDAPQVVAGPGRLATPEVAIDPVTDVAVAVWRDRGRTPGIDYAVRGTKSAASVAGRPASGRQGTPAHADDWRAVAAIVVVGLCALGLFAGGRRRRIRRDEERRRRWMRYSSPRVSRSDPWSRPGSGHGRFRPTVDTRRRTSDDR